MISIRQWILVNLSAALKVAGNFTKNVKHVAIEKAYFESINANYNPMDESLSMTNLWKKLLLEQKQ